MPACPWPKKRRYDSKREAQAHYDELNRRYEMSDFFQAYKCPGNNHWHLGNDVKKLNHHIKRALRVGSAASRRQSRVRKRR